MPTAKGKAAAAKGKAAAVKGNVTAAKGTAAAAAGDGGHTGGGAKKDLPAVEGIRGLRLGDCAERGKSGSETWHV